MKTIDGIRALAGASTSMRHRLDPRSDASARARGGAGG